MREKQRRPISVLIESSSLGNPVVRSLRTKTPRAVAEQILSEGILSATPYSSIVEREHNRKVGTEMPGFTEKYLEEIRSATEAHLNVLTVARERRDAALAAAKRFDGALRSFSSGSIAHGTAIRPVSDADCGVVLDRRHFPNLGPDGEGEGPRDIVREMKEFIGPSLREKFPRSRLEITKRAIKIAFDEPVNDEEDPSVDLVVCLTRRDAEGLWIPNVESNTWDASHPEKHTELINVGGRDIVIARARAIRMSKVWKNQYNSAPLSSFNLEAIALDAINEAGNLDRALLALFEQGAEQLSKGPTPDPAGVSAPIKVPDIDTAVRCLRSAADGLAEALRNDDDDKVVREALSRVFWDYIDPSSDNSKGAWASAIRSGSVSVGSTGLSISKTDATRRIKSTRSHGDER